MENASKALLIAGGVLIAILVASLGVYFSRTMSDDVAEFYKRLEENKRTEFNQKFLNFENDETIINIQDIVTIINLAKDSNKQNDLEEVTPPSNPLTDNSFYVTVEYDGSSNDSTKKGIERLLESQYKNLEKLTSGDIDKMITEEMSRIQSEIRRFKCKVYVNASTGYVNYIRVYQ